MTLWTAAINNLRQNSVGSQTKRYALEGLAEVDSKNIIYKDRPGTTFKINQFVYSLHFTHLFDFISSD